MQHLAIIPDGNRRWAAAHKLESFLGHKKGVDAIENAVSVCIKNKIKYLSLYTFSFENFRRSEAEKKYLFSLVQDEFKKQLPRLIKNKIQIRFIGDQHWYPDPIKETLARIQEETKQGDALIF